MIKSNNNNNVYELNNQFNPIIKNSLDYYDIHQPKIQQILDKIEFIKIINGVNVNDEYIFYDSNSNIILNSKIETLGMFIPQNNTWKWSWSIPFAKFHNTLISRKILEYAFTLNSTTDLSLKSTLINSELGITNQYQIDIYLALSAMLSKKPFIIRLYLYPYAENAENLENAENAENTKNIENAENIYYYKKILNNPDRKNFISVYALVLDWKH